MAESRLVMVGVNHKGTPVEIRERLAFTPSKIEESAERLVGRYEIIEHIILSTCNRVEIYARVKDQDEGIRSLKKFIAEFHGLSFNDLDRYFYSYRDYRCVEHLFCVSSSLDSMVLGESQVLGQVKDAYNQARAMQATGMVLNQLFEKAFTVAKKVREETGIAERGVSISSAAVELARKIFEDLENHSILLVGAGEMAELAAKHLISYGVKTVYVASRTYERAVTLASTLNGAAIDFANFNEELHRADIVITSTGAPHFIIKKEMIEQAIHKRKNKPMFFIDIAVPRDIEPEVNELENVYLYDIDDLQSVVSANIKEREKEAIEAMDIIHGEVEKFNNWVDSLDAVPTIVELRNKAELIRQKELDRTLKKMGSLSEEDRLSIEQMTTSIINKILHHPTINLKKKTQTQDGHHYLKAIRHLFHLDD
ncbi:MAG: glutamyl-tRNA reductase [Candidatus Nitrohelix vancouverensis]|uniref:Glutamyl-tRNA reductase n=1 Tax=Candidatus Nitrohelix vancouverensis TaxID=2705534 RepID=A0A7T0C3P3_9BACT|nr:MAG: glutamyl-tRNA reductase [Candidatus Nitrohelix vancouverensis]